MAPADLDAVMELQARAFAEPWSRALFEKELALDRSRLRLARDEAGRPVGLVVAWVVLDELHVLNVATAPEVRRAGVARALLHALLDEAKGEGCQVAQLEVRAGNAPALGLYASLGFRRVGLRRRYYPPDGEDAVLMTLELPG